MGWAASSCALRRWMATRPAIDIRAALNKASAIRSERATTKKSSGAQSRPAPPVASTVGVAASGAAGEASEAGKRLSKRPTLDIRAALDAARSLRSTTETDSGDDGAGGAATRSLQAQQPIRLSGRRRTKPVLDFAAALESVTRTRSTFTDSVGSKERQRKLELQGRVVAYQRANANDRRPPHPVNEKLLHRVLNRTEVPEDELRYINRLVSPVVPAGRHDGMLDDPMLRSFRMAIERGRVSREKRLPSGHVEGGEEKVEEDGEAVQTNAFAPLSEDARRMHRIRDQTVLELKWYDEQDFVDDLDRPLFERSITDEYDDDVDLFQSKDEFFRLREQQLEDRSSLVELIERPMSVFQVAHLLNRPVEDVLRELREEWAQPCDETSMLHPDSIEMLLDSHNFDVRRVAEDTADVTFRQSKEEDDYMDWPRRPPIVCIMGHVDHGKTTLIDTLRNSSLAKGEVGNITQSIGAFEVDFGSHHDSLRRVTFLDTPGHAAFRGMRQFGAAATDVVVLVVSATEGVRPQTQEAIRYILESDLPAIVCINKVDLPDANPEAVEKELLEHGIQTETYGGDVLCVRISALKGTGLDKLGDALALLTDMLELRAPVDAPAEAIVVERATTGHKGTTVHVVVAKGTLHVGDHVVCGKEWGRVRTMQNCRGQEITQALPGQPVTFSGMPSVDGLDTELVVVESAERAEAVVEARVARVDDAIAVDKAPVVHVKDPLARISRRLKKMNKRLHRTNPQKKKLIRTTERDISALYQEGKELAEDLGRSADTQLDVALEFDEATGDAPPSVIDVTKRDSNALDVIVRADVNGSLQTVLDYISALPQDEVRVNVLEAGIGPLTMADLKRMKATRRQLNVFSFNVSASPEVVLALERQNMRNHEHRLVYDLFDDFRDRLSEKLPVTYEDEVVGKAIVGQVFPLHGKRREISKVAAGCIVKTGRVDKQMLVKVLRYRDGQQEDNEDEDVDDVERDVMSADTVAKSLKVLSVRKHDEDVNKVEKGDECGVVLQDFMDVRTGDILHFYEPVAVKRQFDDLAARNHRPTSSRKHKNK